MPAVSLGTLAPRNAGARTVACVTPCTEPVPARLGTMAPAVSKVRAALNHGLGRGLSVTSEPPLVGKASVRSARQAQA